MRLDSVRRWRSAAEEAATRALGEEATRWLAQPNPDLGGKAPESLLTDRIGVQMVIALLNELAVPGPAA
jgi:uncharacterized protein (DUF2384 family)